MKASGMMTIIHKQRIGAQARSADFGLQDSVPKRKRAGSMMRTSVLVVTAMLVGLIGAPAGAQSDSGATAAVAGAPATTAFKTEELEQLVAPIALYPDSLLAQVLMASTYPFEIVQAD